MDRQYLSSKQKRLKYLQEQVENFSTEHLATFIDGIAEVEPPKYHYIDGAVQPPLVQVKLREGANTFDLGNVESEKDNIVHHVKIIADKGRLKHVKMDPLPQDGSNIMSTPIDAYFLKTLEGMWRTKYQLIREHCDAVNAIRNFTHHTLTSQPKRRTIDGQVR
jgi:hypothetical protein